MVGSTMKITGITRKARGVVPICIGLFIIYYLYNHASSQAQVEEYHEDEVLTHKFPVPTEPPNGLWLLVFSSNPSDCFSLVGSFSSWNILIATPKPTNVRHGRCWFFIIEEKSELENEYLTSQFGRNSTNAVIVQCINHLKQFEPKAVYIAPTVNDLAALRKPLHMEASFSSKLIYGSSRTTSLFNTDGHFGCNTDSQFLNRSNYQHCNVQTAVVEVPALIDQVHRQGVTSEESLTHSILCDEGSPSVLLQFNNYAVTTFDTGLFRYDYLWIAGLDRVISTTEENRFLTNLGLQKVIWLTGDLIKIYPDAVSLTTPSSFDKISHAQVLTWIFDIESWSCDDDMVNTCVINLMLFLKGKDLIKSSTVRNVQSYFAYLVEGGYEFPYVTDYEPLSSNADDKEHISLYPINMKKKTSHVKQVNNMEGLIALHKRTCSSFSNGQFSIDNALSSPWLRFPDILLLVVFNIPHYETIPYIELLYAPFFPRIIFCGPGFPDPTKFKNLYSSSGTLTRSFLSYGGTPEGHVPGAFNYACAKMAMEMQFNVAGYLVMADDTLLLVNNIKALKRDSIWFLPQNEMRIGEITKLRECKLNMCDFYPHWDWWADYQRETISLLKHMEKEQERSPLIYKCYQQLIHLNGAPLRPSGGYSDVYYIPQRLASDFAQLSQLFLDYGIFLEIAIPTMIRCLDFPGDIEAMRNEVIWTETRDQPWIYFNRKNLFGKAFYHPAKWSNMTSTYVTPLHRFYCNELLPFLHDPLERFPSSKKKELSRIDEYQKLAKGG